MRDLAPRPGSESTPPAFEGKVLTTGPPGKPHFLASKGENRAHFCPVEVCLTSKAQDVRRGKTVLGVNCFWATVSHQWRKSAEFKRRTGCVRPADPGWRAGEDA